MFDKQIHKNDFRLRLLLTNDCNRNCYHCLNDFQPKKPVHYLDFTVAKKVIYDYCVFMGRRAKIEFSGGEPGLHPKFKDMVLYAKQFLPTIKVNTNGTALKYSNLFNIVNKWHVGAMYPYRYMMKSINAQIQIVVTEKNLAILDAIVSYYGEYRIPIKLFTDFFSNKTSMLQKQIEIVSKKYPNYTIKSRYTGIQENRGKLCSDCNKKCITLKALWVFPDGTVSACPQKKKRSPYYGISQIIDAFKAHKIEESWI